MSALIRLRNDTASRWPRGGGPLVRVLDSEGGLLGVRGHTCPLWCVSTPLALMSCCWIDEEVVPPSISTQSEASKHWDVRRHGNGRRIARWSPSSSAVRSESICKHKPSREQNLETQRGSFFLFLLEMISNNRSINILSENWLHWSGIRGINISESIFTSPER